MQSGYSQLNADYIVCTERYIQLEKRKMNYPKFDEILNQYQFGNKEGNGYSLFQTHKDWFVENIGNGNLKLDLLKTLEEVKQNNDLRKYDFVLLIIQAFGIDFSKNDKHFELLFLIADSITEDFKVSTNGDQISWLLHQLTDICIHNYDEVELVIRRNLKLIIKVLRKIGTTKYESNGYGPQMYFATYKAVGIFWHLPKEERKKLLNEIYLNHFDERVIEEAEELIGHLKEEGRYD